MRVIERILITVSLLSFVFSCICSQAGQAQFPKLSGEYHVGTKSFHLVDRSRDELCTLEIAEDKRELMVQVWYPAAPSQSRPARWLPDSDSFIPQAKKAFPEVPDLYWQGCPKILANAVEGTPLPPSATNLPVILYAHGWAQMRAENTFLMEELVSHGYVAVAIDFPYNSRTVRFPDGRVISAAPGFSHPVIKFPTLDTQVKDVQFVRDHLESLNNQENGEFSRRLDLSRLAIMGFSHGGIVSLEVLRSDPRFRAGLVLDVKCDVTGLNQPFMILARSGTPVRHDEKQPNFGSGGYVCKIEATRHFNFSDLALAWALLELPGGFPQPNPSNDPIRIHRVIADYALAFFDKHLKAKRAELLDGASSNHPEVKFLALKPNNGRTKSLETNRR